ncbi:MAG TPA: hypothetical protein VFG20_13590 [Planctomycetaceae bacterium]|nr:hypothetical protein [Planctomycetaceae bacterium]
MSPNRWSMWRAAQVVALCQVTFAVGGIARAEEPATTDPQAEKRQLRMATLFEDTSLRYAQDPARDLVRSPKAVVKYTNPLNSFQLYASMFLWFDGEVPVAVSSPSFRDTGNIYWEWTSLTSQPLVLKRQDRVVWQPEKAGHNPQRLPDADSPADSAAARLTQMRAIARRFMVTEVRRETTQETRLLTQPLYRWKDPSHDVIDAAMFAFVEATDPELLLLIEARLESGKTDRVWFYTLARMTSSPCTVKLDEQTVWSTEAYWKNPRASQDPYIEAVIGKFDVEEFFR